MSESIQEKISKAFSKLQETNEVNAVVNSNRNSAKTWFPPIKDHLPVPKTIMLDYKPDIFLKVIEHGEQLSPCDKAYLLSLYGEIDDACKEIGYPCFLRTDLTSAKHSGPCGYLLLSWESIQNVLFKTVEDSEMKLWPMAQSTSFMVRKFLDLNAKFTAFHGLPIAREFRFFADKTEVKCFHPYWPESSIHLQPGQWQVILKEHHKTPDNIDELKELAVKACSLIDDNVWSVDFAQDIEGKWWLIDMARGEDSYHWEGCDAI